MGPLTDALVVEQARSTFAQAFHFEPQGTLEAATEVEAGAQIRYPSADGSYVERTCEYVPATAERRGPRP
ncbi:hypothetical protein PQQ84_36055 [Paraburkholderia strydomiana]|uniref:hypothetical protein n=1 Tax=Paraburkholderia strydomiana TaxID=1245417 RepID=UPI0038B89396